MQVVVLGVQSWSFQDDQTKQSKTGSTVYYFDPAEVYDDAENRGLFPAKITVDSSLAKTFTTLPGKYNFDIKLKRIGGGRSGATLVSATLVSSMKGESIG